MLKQEGHSHLNCGWPHMLEMPNQLPMNMQGPRAQRMQISGSSSSPGHWLGGILRNIYILWSKNGTRPNWKMEVVGRFKIVGMKGWWGLYQKQSCSNGHGENNSPLARVGLSMIMSIFKYNLIIMGWLWLQYVQLRCIHSLAKYIWLSYNYNTITMQYDSCI